MTRAIITLFASAARVIEDAFRATPLETVAFGFAGRVTRAEHSGLVVGDVEVVPDECYLERSEGRFSLDPRYVAEVGLRALERDRSVVIVHSHPGWSVPPRFSPIDERMHTMLVPSLLRKLRGPVGSLVWSPGGWSGRVWRDAETSLEVDVVRAIGRRLTFVGPGVQATDSDQFDRQIRAFGAPAQRAIGTLSMGIVGLGGTGSLACEWAAHLGVTTFLLVDPDKLEPSNLSRVVGSGPNDVGVAKVELAERMVRRIRPEAVVRALRADVRRCDALRALATCDVVLACTDSHSSRAALNRLPYQYGVALIDIGTLLRKNAATTEAFADVRLATPDRACLRCQGAIDAERVTLEQRTPDERRVLAARGYAPSHDLPAPSVLPVNALAVSLAMLRLIDLVEPWLSWDGRITVEAGALRIVERPGEPIADCDVCGSDAALTAAADDEPLACIEGARQCPCVALASQGLARAGEPQ